MAEVHAATRGGVAGVLKRIRPDQATNAAFVALMAREAEALRRVRHDAVVRLLDAGPGWVVLERGTELPSPASWDEVRAVVARVLAALAEAHGAGVLHRDVKAGNVLATSRGPVLADWGAARVAGLPDPARALGTPAAMAPERLRGEAATAASDVWAAGALGWELATGAPPFPGARWEEVLASHARGLPAFAPRFPVPDQGEWLRGLLAPDPHARPTAKG